MAIIKCTECGHSVSTNAPMCPECGVRIENNLRQCSSCQKQVLKTDRKCVYCGYALQEEKAPSADVAVGDSEKNSPQSPKKHKKYIVWIILFLLLLSGGGAIFYYFQKQNALKEEYSTYVLLEGCTRIDAYEDFIQRYPNSQYIADVEQRLSNIKLEQTEWNRIVSRGSKLDFMNFVSNHPTSPYVNSCQNKIDSLDWIQAERMNTEEAYYTYLSEHANGIYAQEASYKLEKAKKLIVSPGEITFIKGICNNFFTSLSTKDEEGIKNVVSSALTNFMNKAQATPMDVVNYMNSLYADKSTQSVRFTINDDFLVKKEVVSDTTDVAYDVTFSVDQIVNSTDLKKDGFVTYQVTTHIAPNAKIDRFNMQKKVSE